MIYETQASRKGNDPERVIISAALTGALTTRDQCEAIPYTPEEIAEEAAAAREAGAAIAHIHALVGPGVDVPRHVFPSPRSRRPS